MGLFSKKQATTAKGSKRVVVTGKRIEGTWSMESKLPPRARRSISNEGVLITENQRVRTLH